MSNGLLGRKLITLGGDRLAKEVIDKIRNAEMAGENAEKEARERGEALVREARENAKKEAAERISAARRSAAGEADDAAEMTRRRLAEAKESAESSTGALKSAAQAKKNQAIDAIITKMLGS